MASSILVINGPNLNLLGTREPELYGRETLEDIEAVCRKRGDALGLDVEFVQSNHEGQLVDWIHGARTERAGLIVNAGAYTHTSVTLLDALSAVELPVVEVHLSNLQKREEFRHHSYVAKAAIGSVCGFGGFGYEMALEALARHLGKTTG